jgi:hypothetical protein
MKKFYVTLLIFFSFTNSGSTINLPLKNNLFLSIPISGSKFITSERMRGKEDLTGNDPRVKIFPNPTIESFKIEIDADKTAELEIVIYNAIGKPVYSSKEFIPPGTFTKLINFEDQPSGIYFINVKAGEIKSVERLIKIK